MPENRFQHLADAFSSIISMMLASLRARGLRGLLDLPQTIMVAIYLRRIGREFAALSASLDLSGIDLSALPPQIAAAPPPPAAPVQPASAGAQPRPLAHSPATHRPRAPSGARHTRQAASAQPVSAKPARRQAYPRPSRAPDPRAILDPPLHLHDRAPRETARRP